MRWRWRRSPGRWRTARSAPRSGTTPASSRWPAWYPGRTRRRRRASSCGSWRRMDNAYYEDLAGRLYGLVIRISDRIPADSAGWVHHVTEVGEYELALEDLAAILADGKTPITDQERTDMLALGRKMTLRHDLAGVLEDCPRAGQDHGPDSRQTTRVRNVSPARGEAHVR